MPRVNVAVKSVVICSNVKLIIQFSKLFGLLLVEAKSVHDNNSSDNLHDRKPEPTVFFLFDYLVVLLTLILEIESALLVMANVNSIGLNSFLKKSLHLGNVAAFLSEALRGEVLLEILVVEKLIAVLRA